MSKTLANLYMGQGERGVKNPQNPVNLDYECPFLILKYFVVCLLSCKKSFLNLDLKNGKEERFFQNRTFFVRNFFIFLFHSMGKELTLK